MTLMGRQMQMITNAEINQAIRIRQTDPCAASEQQHPFVIVLIEPGSFR